MSYRAALRFQEGLLMSHLPYRSRLLWYCLLLVPISLSACTCSQKASDVDPDVITQRYAARYDGAVDKTDVEASLGGNIILDGSAKVTHDAYELTRHRSYRGGGN